MSAQRILPSEVGPDGKCPSCAVHINHPNPTRAIGCKWATGVETVSIFNPSEYAKQLVEYWMQEWRPKFDNCGINATADLEKRIAGALTILKQRAESAENGQRAAERRLDEILKRLASGPQHPKFKPGDRVLVCQKEPGTIYSVGDPSALTQTYSVDMDQSPLSRIPQQRALGVCEYMMEPLEETCEQTYRPSPTNPGPYRCELHAGHTSQHQAAKPDGTGFYHW